MYFIRYLMANKINYIIGYLNKFTKYIVYKYRYYMNDGWVAL